MSSLLAFVDESVRSGRYVLCLVLVEPDGAGGHRRRVRKLLLAGQRKLHFTKESVRRRKELLAAFGMYEVRATAYVCRMRDGRDEHRARAVCLERAVNDLQGTGREVQLLIESRGGLDDRDGLVIVRARTPRPALSFEHVRPDQEPLLWLADGLAWTVSAAGEWRRFLPAWLAVVEVS